jgi:hypothetical protein
MGPSTCVRVAEVTSGRVISRQGLTATCKDRAHKAEAKARGGIWSGVWVRRSDEGGVIPSEATREVVPIWGNTPGGQRGLGHWVANEARPWEGGHDRGNPVEPFLGRAIMVANVEARRETDWPVHYPPTFVHCLGVSWSWRRGGRQTIGARGVCESALKPPYRWAGPRSDKWRAEPRSEPDSGNPTVRDRRAALRTVAGIANGVLVRALNFEPDNRTHGLRGGRGNGLMERRAPDYQ